MYGPDKYDSPVGSDYYYDEGGGKADEAVSLVKAHLGKIIALVVLLVIAYFLYYYFIGSMREVSISVEDTEGSPINNARVQIFAEGSDKPIEEFTGTGTVTLRAGDYSITVVAANYKSVVDSPLNVEAGEGVQDELPIELEKKLKIELEVVEFPETLVAGQVATASINLSNNGTRDEEVELAFSTGISDNMEITYTSPIIVPTQGSKDVTLNIFVNDDASHGEESGTIRVKYLNNSKAKKTVEYLLLKFDSSKVKFSPSKFNFGTINGGEVDTINITIKNNNRNFTMKDITYKVSELSAQNNDDEEIKSWISFLPESIQELKYGSEEKQTIVIKVEVPLNAKSDTVTGFVEFSTSYWDTTVNFNFDVEGAVMGLELSGINPSYKLNFDDELEIYMPIDDTLEIKNVGDVDLEDVSVYVDEICDNNWVKVIDDEFAVIRAGEKEDIRIQVLASPDTPKTYQECKIFIFYQNPITIERERFDETIQIETDRD